jgi:response regulator RpfG family c-di-GMP phosphodiesterase
MDGFDVVRLLKNNPRTSGIPIIVVTALQDVASHRRMLASGVDEFINKPVDRWELSLRISRLLKQDPPSGVSGTDGPTRGEA